jgi:hypothetical protein
MTLKNLDPELKHLLGDANDEAPIDGDDSDFDPVGNFLHEIRYGIPFTPVKKLSAVEITDALDKVRLAVGAGERGGGLAQRLKAFPLAAMAESAETYLEDDSPVRAFLKAAAAGSDDGMRRAIREIVLRDGPLQ